MFVRGDSNRNRSLPLYVHRPDVVEAFWLPSFLGVRD